MSELKAAAERLDKAIERGEDLAFRVRMTDPTPIDEAWLLNVGFADCTNGLFILTIAANHDLFAEREDDGWKVTFLQRFTRSDPQVKLPMSFNRGQLRCLCMGLNIPLTE